MTTIAILPERRENQLTIFNAVTKQREASGRTAGEALDRLTAQLSEEETGTMIIVQQFRADCFFSAAQHERLNLLLARRRASNLQLPADEQIELEELIDAEVRATAERSNLLLGDLTSEVG